MDDIVDSSLEYVGTCNELNAGYAADAYARVRGIGAVCVTYAVGGFSLLNAVAGSHAERVPVVVLCGGPSLADREHHRKLHHTLGYFDIQVGRRRPLRRVRSSPPFAAQKAIMA